AQRFDREIRTSDRVRSAWTVSVVDFSTPGASLQWLATKYIAAPPLGDWTRHNGPMTEAPLRCLARELSAALVTVQAAGVVHRDIKPANILLGRERPFLIDFGIARTLRETRHTQTGTVIGTPGNRYILTHTPPDRLTLEPEGTQSAGAPTTLTRHPSHTHI
ncbi:protein kinase, partial [Streptomyces sp. NPDC059949]|uniref:protein kinase domain-containing protein n=1 Tax=Streptomyces sp. NPDC059949 TaxID=3347013 RepID=UPI00365EC32F